MEKTFAVIMAGGIGSRFWPESRAKSPKQLLDLTNSGMSMIAATAERLQPEIPVERILVVTSEQIASAVAAALPDLPPENILQEPVGRNTAPCIGWAALHARRRDPEAVLAVLPSDHVVADTRQFAAACDFAVSVANRGSLVTFGVAPSHPETGFGYIELGIEVQPGLRLVKRFVEKPDRDAAVRYVQSGNYVWNSGMFFFSAERILTEIASQMPALMRGLEEIEASIKSGNEAETVRRIYPTLPSQSIDYGIMEGAEKIFCVPVDFGWSDLGSWAAAYDNAEKDNQDNVIGKDAAVVDSFRCLVRAPQKKLVALVGVEDLVVVDTGDALLVCHVDRAQDVKRVVEEIQARGRGDLL